VEILRDYFFRARHLGEKWPASDFYVELIGPTDRFFFIVEFLATEFLATGSWILAPAFWRPDALN